jgi:hypothetical protein
LAEGDFQESAMARDPNWNADRDERQAAKAAALIDDRGAGTDTPRDSWTAALWRRFASGARPTITAKHVTWGLVVGWTAVAILLLVMILPVMI